MIKKQRFIIIFFLIICLLDPYVQRLSPFDTIIDKNKLIIESALITEVDDYISKTSPSSQLNATVLVKKCLEYDLDIIFVLAQGQIESNFGTAGIATKTNSVWNVNSYDGRSAQYIIKNKLGYIHPNHSIEPYLQLIKYKYLSTNKTEYDLMNNFISNAGYRYASSIIYEYQLKSLYNRINNTTNIKKLQNHIKNYQ